MDTSTNRVRPPPPPRSADVVSPPITQEAVARMRQHLEQARQRASTHGTQAWALYQRFDREPTTPVLLRQYHDAVDEQTRADQDVVMLTRAVEAGERELASTAPSAPSAPSGPLVASDPAPPGPVPPRTTRANPRADPGDRFDEIGRAWCKLLLLCFLYSHLFCPLTFDFMNADFVIFYR